jgi:antitoxin component of RelBE/YafQ-DinJ toxin-antitoxin module
MFLEIKWKVEIMVEIEKKKVTLSLPVDTNKKLEELCKKYGMTKSGLVNFLINQVAESGSIYNKQ